MTVIEFFDRDSAVENVVSTLLCVPEKVVFIGSNIKQINKSIKIYQSVAESRGLKVEFIPKGVNRNNLTVIIETLENIIEENDDCVIDLSGGDELYLVAVGAVYEKYADRIKLHRFNINNGTMITVMLTVRFVHHALCNSALKKILLFTAAELFMITKRQTQHIIGVLIRNSGVMFIQCGLYAKRMRAFGMLR